MLSFFCLFFQHQVCLSMYMETGKNECRKNYNGLHEGYFLICNILILCFNVPNYTTPSLWKLKWNFKILMSYSLASLFSFHALLFCTSCCYYAYIYLRVLVERHCDIKIAFLNNGGGEEGSLCGGLTVSQIWKVEEKLEKAGKVKREVTFYRFSWGLLRTVEIRFLTAFFASKNAI